MNKEQFFYLYFVYNSNELDYLYYFGVLIILGFLWIFISKPKKLNLFLYIIHSLLGILFLYYSKNFEADSFRVYVLGSPDYCGLIFNQGYIINSGISYCASGITKLFINNYGFSTGIFSFIGFLGLNIFFNFLIKISINIKDKFRILYFFTIPSISFWTTGIGKDTLIILSYGLIFKFISADYLQELSQKTSTIKRRLNNFVYLSFGLVFSYFTRTYTLYILAISLLFSRFKDFLKIIFNLRLKKSQLFLIPILIIIFLYANSLLFDILNFSNSQILNNFDLIEQRALVSKINAIESGGSFVSQEGIQKLIYIIGGPFSFKNINFIVESFTGIVFISIFYSIFRNINILKKNLISNNRLILFLISLGTLELIKIYIFAFNEGIIVRQRVIPFILFFIVYYIINTSKYKK